MMKLLSFVGKLKHKDGKAIGKKEYYAVKMNEFYEYLATNEVARIFVSELMENKYKESNCRRKIITNFIKKYIMSKPNDPIKPPPPPQK